MTAPGKAAPPGEWTKLAQTAAWVTAVVFTFLVVPPGHALSQEGSYPWSAFASFVVAVVVGIAVAVALGARAQRRGPWLAVAVAAFVAGTALFATYGHLRAHWTCTVSGTALVIGDERLPEAARDPPGRTRTCADLLADFASDPMRVWRPEAVLRRETLLGWNFVAVVGLFGLSIVALLQAVTLGAPAAAGSPAKSGGS